MPELPRLFGREPITHHDAEHLAFTLKAAVSAPRLRILSILASEPGLIAEDFVPLLGLGQPTIAHHMSVLREAGLVAAVRDGRRVQYTVDRDAFRALADAIRLAGVR